VPGMTELRRCLVTYEGRNMLECILNISHFMEDNMLMFTSIPRGNMSK
jgi:hypothetical protein